MPEKPSDSRPIGVFDSGLGGLSAVRKLKEMLPCPVVWGAAGSILTCLP